jgi:hypothetical protein
VQMVFLCMMMDICASGCRFFFFFCRVVQHLENKRGDDHAQADEPSCGVVGHCFCVVRECFARAGR